MKKTVAMALFVLCSVMSAACHATMPMIRFAPAGTDPGHLLSKFALTDAERLAMTPDNLRALTQDQIDQIYNRLSAGPTPDGPFRGDLFFPRDANRHARLTDMVSPVPGFLADVATRPVEQLGRALWRGKVFFRSYAQGPEVEGDREIPDKLAGSEGLKILDEIRIIRPGFYLGRAYFGQRFGLNFTLIDPAIVQTAPLSEEVRKEC